METVLPCVLAKIRELRNQTTPAEKSERHAFNTLYVSLSEFKVEYITAYVVITSPCKNSFGGSGNLIRFPIVRDELMRSMPSKIM